MSHTNSTPNYQLPQFVGTDKPAYLTDFNQAFSAIDTGIHAAKTAADTAGTDITEVENDLNETNQNVTALSSTVSTLQGTVTSVSQTANQANTKVDNLSEKFNLGTVIDLTESDLSEVAGGNVIEAKIKIVKNSDGSLFKIYGYARVENITNSNISFTLNNTSILTSSPFTVQGNILRRTYAPGSAGSQTFENLELFSNRLTVNNNSMNVSTSGVRVDATALNFDFIAVLLFNSNFDDDFNPTE